MKFRDAEGNDYLFDEFPKVFNPTQLVFFTHLHHLNEGPLKLPLKLPKIYTTKCIAEKLINAYPLAFSTSNFHMLLPFQSTPIQLYNGKTVTVFTCEEDDLGYKLMIIIKNPDKHIYFYAGICTDFQNMLRSDSFATLLSDATVSELILHLVPVGCMPWTESVRHVTHTKAIIEKIHEFDVDNKLCFVIPTFGFEPLISRIVYNFRGRVYMSEAYAKLSDYFNADYLEPNPDEAFIQITNKMDARSSRNRHTIKIVDITKPDADKSTVYKWSPYPTAFELLLLIILLKPKHIVNSCNTITAPTNYLKEFNELLKRHPEKPKLRTPTTKTITPKITPSSATRIPPAQPMNLQSTHRAPYRSTISPQTVNSPTRHTTRRRTTISKAKNSLAPFVVRKRHLDYASEGSSSE